MKTLLLLLLLAACQAQEQKTHQVWCKVTAYCPCKACCGPNAKGLTSTGLRCKVHPYGVAVDPRGIPYGTTLVVPGYGTAKADDTGAAMRQDWTQGVTHIDIRFKTHQEAKNWGVRWMWIEVQDA